MTDRPTICQVLHGLSVGGAEVLAARIARRLSDQFHFTFICLDEVGTLGEQLRDEGFPVTLLRRNAGVDVRCTWRLAKQLKLDHVDLIHAHQYTPFFYSITARLLYRRPPILFTEHGRWHPDYPRRKRILANRLLLQKRDRVVGVGENVRQALIHNEGIAAERVEVIYNGIDLTPYSNGFSKHASIDLLTPCPTPSVRVDQVLAMADVAGDSSKPLTAAPVSPRCEGRRVRVSGEGPIDDGLSSQAPHEALSAIRQEMGVGPNDLVIIQVARLDALKDHATAINAMARLVRTRPDARLVLVGEGPELGNIQRVVHDLGVEQNVRLMGLRRDVPRLLRAADVFLLSSKSEGIPLTIIEAMAAGVPVVSTDVGGIAEIICHGQTGLLASAGDSDKLAESILELAGDPMRKLSMTSQAKERAFTVFSESQMHSSYLRTYNEMLATRKPEKKEAWSVS